MSRSVWKVPFVSRLFFSNFLAKKKNFNVWQRSSKIPSSFVNKRIRIHNGIWLLSLNVKPNMVGYKFGEFSFSKRMGKIIHFQNKSKKKQK